MCSSDLTVLLLFNWRDSVRDAVPPGQPISGFSSNWVPLSTVESIESAALSLNLRLCTYIAMLKRGGTTGDTRPPVSNLSWSRQEPLSVRNGRSAKA